MRSESVAEYPATSSLSRSGPMTAVDFRSFTLHAAMNLNPFRKKVVLTTGFSLGK